MHSSHRRVEIKKNGGGTCGNSPHNNLQIFGKAGLSGAFSYGYSPIKIRAGLSRLSASIFAITTSIALE